MRIAEKCALLSHGTLLCGCVCVYMHVLVTTQEIHHDIEVKKKKEEKKPQEDEDDDVDDKEEEGGEASVASFVRNHR